MIDEKEQRPPKLCRFLLWVSVSPEERKDALVAFDEGWREAAEEFGERYATLWAIRQGLRGLPYGLVVFFLRLTGLI
jgi:hypothetical protein